MHNAPINPLEWLTAVLAWIAGITMTIYLLIGWGERVRKAIAYRRDPALRYNWRRAWEKAGEA